MPAAGAFIAQGIFVLSGVIGTTAAVTLFNAGAALAVMYGLNRIARKFAETPDYSSSASGMQVLVRSTTEYRRIVYGETLVGGVLVYQNTAGSHNQRLWSVVAFAGHEIEDITDFWIDERRIPVDYINWDTDGKVNSGFFRGNPDKDEVVYLFHRSGTSDSTYQTAYTNLVTSFTEYTTAHRGRGIAHAAIACDYFKGQEDVWKGGAPQNFRALVQGKKVYNPASDSNNGGTGPQRVDVRSTWAWSANPALCLADYLRDDELGFAESHTRIDWAAVRSAAAHCDGTAYDPDGPQTRYTCNGVLSTGAEHRENIQRLLSSFNGTLVFSNGKWVMRSWDYHTPTVSIDEDDLRGNVYLNANTSVDKRFNAVRAVYVDPNRLYAPSEMVEVTASAYQTRDGEKIYKDLDLPFTNSEYMAQRLAWGMLEHTDHEQVVRWEGKWSCLEANIGENINVTFAPYSWSNKVFKVEGYKLTPQGVDLELREDFETTYTDPSTTAYRSITSSGGVNFAYAQAAPVGTLELNFLENGIRLDWDPPAARLYENVLVYVASADNINSAELLAETRATYYEHVTRDNYVKYYWVRTRDYDGDLSTWTPESNGLEGKHFTGNEFMYDPTFDKSKNADDDRFWTLGTNSTYIGIGTGTQAGDVLILEGTGKPQSRNRKSFPVYPGRTLEVGLRIKNNDRFYVHVYGVNSSGQIATVQSQQAQVSTTWGNADWYNDTVDITVSSWNVFKRGIIGVAMVSTTGATGRYAFIDGMGARWKT